MAVDLSAIAKWPNVPACYDWLSLDRRGNWRMQGERVTHRGLIEFMNRQYGVDEAGCWFVQNGPQRVFVELAATPWIFRYQNEEVFSHTGLPAGTISAVHLDENGSIVLETPLGIGLLDDRDLARFFGECHTATGAAAGDEALLELMSGTVTPAIYWRSLPLQRIVAVDLPKRFNFEPRPQAQP